MTERALVYLPTIVFWWRWIGANLDYGVLRKRKYEHSKLMTGALLITAFVLICFGGYLISNEYDWWKKYNQWPSMLHMLRSGMPALIIWIIFLAGGAIRVSVQLMRGQFNVVLKNE